MFAQQGHAPDTEPRRDYHLAFSVAPWRRGSVPVMTGVRPGGYKHESETKVPLLQFSAYGGEIL